MEDPVCVQYIVAPCRNGALDCAAMSPVTFIRLAASDCIAPAELRHFTLVQK